MAETVEGGIYVTAQGNVVDANGKPLPEFQYNKKTKKVTKKSAPKSEETKTD